jgi:hypothetical protein
MAYMSAAQFGSEGVEAQWPFAPLSVRRWQSRSVRQLLGPYAPRQRFRSERPCVSPDQGAGRGMTGSVGEDVSEGDSGDSQAGAAVRAGAA